MTHPPFTLLSPFSSAKGLDSKSKHSQKSHNKKPLPLLSHVLHFPFHNATGLLRRSTLRFLAAPDVKGVYDFWELNCKIPTCWWPFLTSHLSSQALGWKTPLHLQHPSKEQWWKSALCCLRNRRPSSLAKKASPWKQVAALPLRPKASRTKENYTSSAVPQLGTKSATASQYYYSLHCSRATDRNFISAFEEEAEETVMLSQPPP